MQSSNKPQVPESSTFARLEHEVAVAVQGLWNGSSGHTVRCVPTRRTVVVEVGGRFLFGKWRVGARRDAAAEWHWLHVLPLLGLRTPVPVVWLGRGSRTLVVTKGVAGRSLDAWMLEATRDGWVSELVDYLVAHVAPLVRRLHDHGLAYRDLYWNHLFVAEPRRGDPPVFLDVERVVRPRWRWGRWVVKDLAGLWSSIPDGVEVPPRAALRFLRAYYGGSLYPHRATLAAIVAKAARIRAHQPRFG